MPKIVLGTEYFNINEIAKMLGVGYQAVYNAIHDGRLKAKKLGNTWYSTKENIDDFLQDFNNK